MGRSSKKEYRKKRTRLATTRRISDMEKSHIRTGKRRNPGTDDRNPPLLGTPGDRQDPRIDDPKLLVAWNEKRHPKIHCKL